MENLYEVLEVSKNASKEVIEKAYKVLAKRYHPDVANNKEFANKMMVKINEAYSILSNEQKRKEYDTMLKEHEIYARETKIRQEQEIYIENQYVQNSRHSGVFSKIRIDNKILVIIIVLAIIFFVFSCVSIWQTVSNVISGDINIDNNYVEYVDDESTTSAVYSLLQGFKALNIEDIILNIVNQDYFNNIDVSLLKENIDMYEKILGDLQITVTSAKSYKDSARLQVVINRNNVEEVFANYYVYSSLGMPNVDKEKERQLLINSIETFSKSINIKDTYLAQKVDGIWKIELTNVNVRNLLGMSISKYQELFEQIY